MLPSSIIKPEAAIAIMLKGHELGIPPMQAFAHISVVNGRPTISAELMLAIIYRDCPQAVISFKKIANEGCIILAARSEKHALTEFAFSIEDAATAKLIIKDNWQNYPRAMCKARTIADMGRTIFADYLMGCSHTREELNPDEPLTIDLEPINSNLLSDPKDQIIEEIKLLTQIMRDEEKKNLILETVEKNENTASLKWFENV